MKPKKDLISSLFEHCRVVIQGDFQTITGEQMEAVHKAARIIQDCGLKTAVTCFNADYSDIKDDESKTQRL